MPQKNDISLKEISFENTRFWAYFLSVNYPCAYLEAEDCKIYDLVEQVLPINMAWSDEFTQYYDGVMEETDGYLEEPTTLTVPLSSLETLKIEFHPGDTIFFINDEEIGCTGPHWKLRAIPYQKVKSLLCLEDGELLFQLLLPMAALMPEETADLKPILEKQLLSFGFEQPLLSQTIDCLISGIKEQV